MGSISLLTGPFYFSRFCRTLQWEKGGILCRAEVRWYTSDSVRKVALIRPGLSRATFPPGEGFEWCHLS